MIRQEWKGTINRKGQRNGEEGRKAKQKYCLWISLEAHVVHKILYSSQECVHAWAEISATSRRKLLRSPLCSTGCPAPLPVQSGSLSPAVWGAHWHCQIHSSPRFTAGLRTEERKPGKSRVWDREGKGQRKENQPAWKSETFTPQWNEGMIIWILSHFSWSKCP